MATLPYRPAIAPDATTRVLEVHWPIDRTCYDCGISFESLAQKLLLQGDRKILDIDVDKVSRKVRVTLEEMN